MKKFLVAMATFSTSLAFGQMAIKDYVVKIQTGQAYTPLTTGTNITSGLLWDEENFKIPMGFSANIGSKSTSDFSLSLGYGFVAGSDTMGIVNTFLAFGNLDLEDRGWLTSTPASPVRYLVSGTAPNRVFKFEIANAGFFDEEINYGTLDDSLNLQVWVYETTSIVEIRYGASKITNPSDYYFFGSGLLAGYISNFDLDLGTVDNIYSLTGNTSSPSIDSTSDITAEPTALTGFPANGTVYRFIPKSVAASIGEINIAEQLKVYPTQATTNITVASNLSTAASADIYAVNGQKILSNISLQKGNNNIDVSTLASGVYFLKISAEEGKADFKFVKQ